MVLLNGGTCPLHLPNLLRPKTFFRLAATALICLADTRNVKQVSRESFVYSFVVPLAGTVSVNVCTISSL